MPMTSKKAIDVLVALCVLVGLGWLILILWALIKIGSDGPGFFAQQRVGKHGAIFTCFKLRTMKLNTTQVGTHEIPAHAVTMIGKNLRRFKLDELPQMVNVLKGEMSIVGPRPCLPSQVKLIEERTKRNVYTVLPGITGLSQINGIDMSDPEKLAISDEKYVLQISLWLDLNILLATLIGKGQGDKIIR
jgi:lipopolysaccharide/colanic/teichoic acid biosynthesis glycosyltransferase